MKKIILIAILFYSFNLFSQGDFLKNPDSKLHFKYSMPISAVSYLIASETLQLPPLQAIVYSSGFDLVGFSFKEIVLDRNFSSSDMLHNIAGLIIGKGLMYVYQTFLKKDSVARFYYEHNKKQHEFISLELIKNKLKQQNEIR